MPIKFYIFSLIFTFFKHGICFPKVEYLTQQGCKGFIGKYLGFGMGEEIPPLFSPCKSFNKIKLWSI